MNTLTNNTRNIETSQAIVELKNADAGAHAEKKAGVANALASLDVAESLQLLQIQLIEGSRANRSMIHTEVDKLIASNERLAKSNSQHTTAMKWLTGALVAVGVLQIVVTWLTRSK